tara:strand:- start:463 stop:1452 length:990 start_codon:yes stop_codon:yes gene_type:complete
MSDAMTNREIEDVLTSIRRLVAQDGNRPGESGKLILTEDQRIVAPPAVNSGAPIKDRVMAVADARQPETPGLTQVEEAPVMTGPHLPRPRARGEPAADVPVETPVETPVGAQGKETGEMARDDASADLNLPEPDFGKLEATIAELEAAVSASGDTWEAESGPVEETPRPSNVTDLYGRLSFGHRVAAAEGAQTGEPGPGAAGADAVQALTTDEVAPEAQPEISEASAGTVAPEESDSDADASPEASAARDPSPEAESPTDDAPILAADTYVDDVTEFEDTILDEDALRAVIAQIVREELHGQLGERITQQVRKLVRSEIAKALDGRRYL